MRSENSMTDRSLEQRVVEIYSPMWVGNWRQVHWIQVVSNAELDYNKFQRGHSTRKIRDVFSLIQENLVEALISNSSYIRYVAKRMMETKC